MKKYISCDFLSFDMFFETPSAGHPYPMFFEILHRVGQGVGSE